MNIPRVVCHHYNIHSRICKFAAPAAVKDHESKRNIDGISQISQVDNGPFTGGSRLTVKDAHEQRAGMCRPKWRSVPMGAGDSARD